MMSGSCCHLNKLWCAGTHGGVSNEGSPPGPGHDQVPCGGCVDVGKPVAVGGERHLHLVGFHGHLLQWGLHGTPCFVVSVFRYGS